MKAMFRTDDLDGKALRRLLVAGGAKTRKIPKKNMLEREEKQFGGKLPSELRALLRIRASHQLEKVQIGEFWPFHFPEPFHLTGRDAASKHLDRATKLSWPVFFEAHFWALFPIGASGSGDYWLCYSGFPNAKAAPVYLYQHETGQIQFETYSITELVYREIKGRDQIVRDYRKKSARPREKSFDPMVLARRATWLTWLLRDSRPSDLEAELSRCAASIKDFEKERPLLGKWPHLALYWLFAHTLLDNKDAFRLAFEATKGSKNAFVVSAREICARCVESNATQLGPLTAAQLKRIRSDLEVAPSKLRDAGAKKALRKAEGKEKKAVKEKLQDGDPWVVIKANPFDPKLQLRCLDQIAKKDKHISKTVVVLRRWNKKGGNPHDKKDTLPKPVDPRLVTTLRALLHAGREYNWHENKSNEQTIAVLKEIATAEAKEALIESLHGRSQSLRRIFLLAQSLRGVVDDRIDKRIASLVEQLALPEHEDLHSSVYEEWTLGILEEHLERLKARGLRAKEVPVIDRALEAETGSKTSWVARLCRFAGEIRYSSAKDGLIKIIKDKEWVEYWDVPAEASWALARINPQQAAKPLVKQWQTEVKSGKSWKNPQGHYDIVELARWLPGLLGLEENQLYLEAAEHILTKVKKTHADAYRYVLNGLQLAADPKSKSWIKPFLNWGQKTDEEALLVRESAKRALEAIA